LGRRFVLQNNFFSRVRGAQERLDGEWREARDGGDRVGRERRGVLGVEQFLTAQFLDGRLGFGELAVIGGFVAVKLV
jgi:hypothetical protein